MLQFVVLFLISLFLAPYIAYFLLFILSLTKKNHNEGASCLCHQDHEPFVSLVTATFNEEKNISRKLQNTFELEYPRDKTEVIIIDSSTDRTREIVEEWALRHPNIKLVKESRRKGLAAALNMAYSAATGEIIIKSDCDIMLDAKSVKQLVSNFADPNVGVVAGKQLLMKESKHEAGYQTLMDAKRLVENQVDSVYMLAPFVGYRRSLIEPLDVNSVADDAELGVKIRKKGYRTCFDPMAHYYEELPSKIRERLKIRQRRAQGHVKLMLGNLGVLFNSRYGKYGLLIFPLNFYLIVVAPWISALMLLLLPISIYLMFGLQGALLCTLLYLLLAASYSTGFPKHLTGFIDSQLALIVGSLNLATKGPESIWSMDRDS